MKTITLTWYRDKGKGERAADELSAVRAIDIWPIAILPCANDKHANAIWEYLYRTYGVNATTVYRS